MVTLTGNINVDLTNLVTVENDKQRLVLNEFTKQMYAQITSGITVPDTTAPGATTTTNVEFVAFTHYEADCDSVCFFKKDGPADLMTAHNEAVKTAMDVRTNMVKMAASLVSKLF